MTPSTALPGSQSQPSRAQHLGLWVAQVLLGLAFLMAGAMKSTQPIAELGAKMVWVTQVPPGLVRFIGVSELLGALGLVLPSALRIMPRLTPLAAAGLVTVMVLAAGFHLTHDQASAVPVNVVLGSIAAFIAWGRFKKAPITSR